MIWNHPIETISFWLVDHHWVPSFERCTEQNSRNGEAILKEVIFFETHAQLKHRLHETAGNSRWCLNFNDHIIMLCCIMTLIAKKMPLLMKTGPFNQSNHGKRAGFHSKMLASYFKEYPMQFSTNNHVTRHDSPMCHMNIYEFLPQALFVNWIIGSDLVASRATFWKC